MDECEDSPVILDFFLLPEKWSIIKFVIKTVDFMFEKC